ncbi:MAG TPA: AAA family ATPase [Miltoncostaea sp.]|nr:AAA family ATPase [Miltoncostaea sp.]
MIGRGPEAAELEALIAAAAAGRSGALLILGEPGIGKTALLRHARRRADGARVLEATGSQGESRLAFAGLADLLSPVLDRLDEIPRAQAEALNGALALGPPAEPSDRFAAYAATLRLLAAAAEREPVLCLVDDAHWLDDESLEAILFASRRLVADGIVVLIAGREGLRSRLDEATLPRRRLRGLAAEHAAILVEDHSGVVPDPAVVAALVEGCAGNPLALIELAGALSEPQLTGAAPLPDPLPVGPHLEQALLRPLETLPAATRRGLLLAATETGSPELLARALAMEGLSMADLEPAERAGVVLIGPARLRFRHPLVRAAVYAGAPAPDRRSAHRSHAAAAEALGDAGALDRRAWHLAMAATGPEEPVAQALEAAAGRAAGRTAYAAACEALEAAARLSPEPHERGRRLESAAAAALAAGAFERASRLFDEVIALGADGGQVLHAMVGRGNVEMLNGSNRAAVDMLAAAGERMREASPAAGAALLVQAVLPCLLRRDLERARELAARAAALVPEPDETLAAQIAAALAITATYSGNPQEIGDAVAGELRRQAAQGDPLGFIWSVGHLIALNLQERYAEALAGLDGLITAAREHGTPSLLPWPLAVRADVRRRTGHLPQASADAAESLRLAEDTGQAPIAGYALAVQAVLHAITGDAAACRERAARAAAIGERTELQNLSWYSDGAVGLLALSQGDLPRAVERFGTLERRYRATGAFHPLLDGHGGDIVETLIRAGEEQHAREVLGFLREQAERAGAAWTMAALERCRGMLATDATFEGHMAAAMALHDRTDTPFERARTLLALGERRRRARRVRQAREPLGAALEAFESLGAARWAEWARRELRAAGTRARPAPPASTGALTPQELQVALSAARGATNRETATALLISPKTVEYHLARVYAKLGVRSRAELAARMAARTSDFLPEDDTTRETPDGVDRGAS